MSSNQPALQILNGPWVTSHSGLLQMTREVTDAYAPPQTAGYNIQYKPDGSPYHFEQREGYFHTAAVTYYDFDGDGNLIGHMEHVRGGYNQYAPIDFQGTYEAWKSALDSGNALYWGRIRTQLPIGEWNFYFVMKNSHEAEWVWTPPVLDPAPPPPGLNQPRPLIARGTLTKIEPVE
jgi:hypothetical protein